MAELILPLQRTVFLPTGSPAIGSISNITADLREVRCGISGEIIYCIGEIDLLVEYSSPGSSSLFSPRTGCNDWQALITLPFHLRCSGTLASCDAYRIELSDLQWCILTARALELTAQIEIEPASSIMETETEKEKTKNEAMSEPHYILRKGGDPSMTSPEERNIPPPAPPSTAPVANERRIEIVQLGSELPDNTIRDALLTALEASSPLVTPDTTAAENVDLISGFDLAAIFPAFHAEGSDPDADNNSADNMTIFIKTMPESGTKYWPSTEKIAEPADMTDNTQTEENFIDTELTENEIINDALAAVAETTHSESIEDAKETAIAEDTMTAVETTVATTMEEVKETPDDTDIEIIEESSAETESEAEITSSESSKSTQEMPAAQTESGEQITGTESVAEAEEQSTAMEKTRETPNDTDIIEEESSAETESEAENTEIVIPGHKTNDDKELLTKEMSTSDMVITDVTNDVDVDDADDMLVTDAAGDIVVDDADDMLITDAAGDIDDETAEVIVKTPAPRERTKRRWCGRPGLHIEAHDNDIDLTAFKINIKL